MKKIFISLSGNVYYEIHNMDGSHKAARGTGIGGYHTLEKIPIINSV